jgi:raffinose/stachyose/melibiose transport system substrate-binding protein
MSAAHPIQRFKALQKRLVACLLGLSIGGAVAEPQTLTLETWRIDDERAWISQILPAFTADHPHIRAYMRPSFPAQYDAELLGRLRQGTAGDLITCRPFDKSIALFDQGYLLDITTMPALRRYRSHSKIAWTTYYADRVFCMPVAAVMTGFFYNTRIFKELNLVPPTTQEELFEVLQTIQRSGTYVPLAFGTKDAWQAAQVLFAGVGPNHWAGEQGRRDLLTGRAKFSDEPFVKAWRTVAELANYMPPNHDQIGEEQARHLFLSGRAAIYPAGSWEIPFLSNHPNHAEFGVFAPPPPQGMHNCYVLNHLDKGIGINPASPRQDQAAVFLDWLATPQFANVLANTLHGFFPLTNHVVEVKNPLANEMLSWRQQCDTTIRINNQFLNQAWPELEQELWDTTVRVIRQQVTPEEAARRISSGVEKWFRPI